MTARINEEIQSQVYLTIYGDIRVCMQKTFYTPFLCSSHCLQSREELWHCGCLRFCFVNISNYFDTSNIVCQLCVYLCDL